MPTDKVEIYSFDSVSRVEELENLLGKFIDIFDEWGLVTSTGSVEVEEEVDALVGTARRILAQDYSGDEVLEGEEC